MSLASHYATVLSEGADVDKTLAYMRKRGHISLLAQVVRILKRQPALSDMPEVLVAKEHDSKTHEAAIRDALTKLGAAERKARVVVDPRAVGGYRVRAGGKTIDRTFRSALVSFYQKATR
ncbi:MAG: F0F1 ATP synthase subunit delta [Patescibacteria group bacterium]|nr:F0F1 ATP synthase subunit delta [Patescibacteria group bacterium]